ncbi:MAG: response regulator [Anaerolineae bacterium]
MDIDAWIKFLTVIISLVQALVWPFLVLFVLLRFRTPLENFLGRMTQVSIKGPGGEITVISQLEIAASLGAATAKDGASSSGPSAQKAREIANLVSRSTQAGTAKTLSDARILWVDDRPSNNVYERRALEALGIHFDLSLSTEDALSMVHAQQYNVIISDMGRGTDPQAGYTLLEEIRKSDDRTPFIIYAGSNAPEHQAETKRRGGFGTTNDPQELFQLVLDAIKNG